MMQMPRVSFPQGASSSSSTGATARVIPASEQPFVTAKSPPEKLISKLGQRPIASGAAAVASSFTNNASERRRQENLSLAPVVLRLRHIGKAYDIKGSSERVVALKDIHLCEDDSAAHTPRTAATPVSGASFPPFSPIRRGEFVMIRGPSGGGKTTLLNIIGTIDACTEGSVELLGEIIDSKSKESHLADIRLRSLGFVFQTFNLISTMTAAENVELPMTLIGTLSDKEIRLRARQLLTLVGLRNRVNHLPSELSGGEQQRVTIARSLANNPAVLLLDEPTGDLDTTNTIEIMDLLIRINRVTNTTCIMVTHNPDIECYADRVLYVSDGRFVREVRNTSPTCLNIHAYNIYLEAKEQELTRVTLLTGEGDAREASAQRKSVSTTGTTSNLMGKESIRAVDLTSEETGRAVPREELEACERNSNPYP